MTRETRTQAISGVNRPPHEDEFRAIGAILKRDAEQIMERWFVVVTTEHTHASQYQRDEIMDDMLKMLQSIGDDLQEHSQDCDRAAHIGALHGQQRSLIGWNIADVVRDYKVLHTVILQHVSEALRRRLTYREVIFIVTLIGRPVESAVEAYSRMAQRRLKDQVRQQQAELRQLTLELTDAQHRERQQIAKLLHDDLQQMMVAVQLQLATALQQTTPEIHSSIAEANRLLQRSIEISRNLAVDLYPLAVESGILTSAIEWLAERFQQRYGLTVNVDLQVPIASEGVAPKPLRRLLYDVIRELLFNVVKHARTDQAWLKISCDEQPVWKIEIEDRGVGSANMKKADSSNSEVNLGLGSARYRIEQLGGTLDVDSKPGKGTRVTLTVPLEPPDDQDDLRRSR